MYSNLENISVILCMKKIVIKINQLLQNQLLLLVYSMQVNIINSQKNNTQFNYFLN